MSDLVEKLRAMDWDYCHDMPHNSTMNAQEAADQLEAKDKLIAELVEALRRVDSDFEQRVSILGRQTDTAEVEVIKVVRLALSKANHNRDRE